MLDELVPRSSIGEAFAKASKPRVERCRRVNMMDLGIKNREIFIRKGWFNSRVGRLICISHIMRI